MPTDVGAAAVLAGFSEMVGKGSADRRGAELSGNVEGGGGRVSDGDKSRSWAARSATGSPEDVFRVFASEIDVGGGWRADGAGKGRDGRMGGGRTALGATR